MCATDFSNLINYWKFIIMYTPLPPIFLLSFWDNWSCIPLGIGFLISVTISIIGSIRCWFLFFFSYSNIDFFNVHKLTDWYVNRVVCTWCQRANHPILYDLSDIKLFKVHPIFFTALVFQTFWGFLWSVIIDCCFYNAWFNEGEGKGRKRGLKFWML